MTFRDKLSHAEPDPRVSGVEQRRPILSLKRGGRLTVGQLDGQPNRAEVTRVERRNRDRGTNFGPTHQMPCGRPLKHQQG